MTARQVFYESLTALMLFRVARDETVALVGTMLNARVPGALDGAGPLRLAVAGAVAGPAVGARRAERGERTDREPVVACGKGALGAVGGEVTVVRNGIGLAIAIADVLAAVTGCLSCGRRPLIEERHTARAIGAGTRPALGIVARAVLRRLALIWRWAGGGTKAVCPWTTTLRGVGLGELDAEYAGDVRVEGGALGTREALTAGTPPVDAEGVRALGPVLGADEAVAVGCDLLPPAVDSDAAGIRASWASTLAADAGPVQTLATRAGTGARRPRSRPPSRTHWLPTPCWTPRIDIDGRP